MFLLVMGIPQAQKIFENGKVLLVGRCMKRGHCSIFVQQKRDKNRISPANSKINGAIISSSRYTIVRVGSTLLHEKENSCSIVEHSSHIESRATIKIELVWVCSILHKTSAHFLARFHGRRRTTPP
jgi:hypothetical protein